LIAENSNKKSADVLTNDNINEVIPPLKVVKEEAPKKNKRIKESRKKNRIYKKKKEKIVEVSTKNTNKRKSSLHYSIQIASYNNKSVARSEVRSLKNLRYDAYIDKTSINGRRYYRVKVGPVFSKRSAINLLNNIQDINRYEDSYLVKE